MRFWFFILVLVSSQSLTAGRVDAEISHLLKFVAKTDYLFVRNGTEHTAAEAVNHMKRKYDYFRDDIDNAEAFIEYSATKSTMSRRPYLIRCKNVVEMTCKQWLLNELSSFRNN